MTREDLILLLERTEPNPNLSFADEVWNAAMEHAAKIADEDAVRHLSAGYIAAAIRAEKVDA